MAREEARDRFKPDDSASEWLDVGLQPLDVDAIVKAPGEDEAVVQTFLGKQNRILLGKPRFGKYVKKEMEVLGRLSQDQNFAVASDCELQQVATNLILLPDTNCTFLSVDFSIELMQEHDKQEQLDPPIVHAIVPDQVVREVDYKVTKKTGAEVGGEITGGLAKVMAKFTQEDTVEKNGVRMIKEILGYGVNFSEGGWRFRANAENELVGDTGMLQLLVEMRKGAQLQGRFRVVAEVAVEFAVDRWLTGAFAPRDEVLDVSYSLSNH